MIGAVLGNWVVVEELGAGGMGKVYKAQHTRLGRRAAVKVLLPEMSLNPEIRQRFFNEAQAAATIDHPSIVDVYDFGEYQGQSYFVMELLSGESLGARLRREAPLGPEWAIVIGHQVAEGLREAHAKGITHRDLKPENLYLSPETRPPFDVTVRILDFGIAKLTEDANVRTKTNMALGTPPYMSPEQFQGPRFTEARSDVYSLGCILFEVVTGRTPFVGEGLPYYLDAHRMEIPPPPRQFNPAVPEALEAVILRCLAKPPQHRPQMSELAVSLRAMPPLSLTSWSSVTVAVVPPAGALATPPAFSSPTATRPGSPHAMRDLPTTMGGAASEVVARGARPSRKRLALAGALVSVIAVVVAVGLAASRSGGSSPKADTPVPAAAPALPSPTATAPVDAGARSTVGAQAAAVPDAGAPAPVVAVTPPVDTGRSSSRHADDKRSRGGSRTRAPEAPAPAARPDAGMSRANTTRQGNIIVPEGMK